MSPSRESKQDARRIDFEKTLEQLERVIAALEAADLPLEEAVKQFEHGMALLKDCRQALTQAEQKVKVLTRKNRDFEMEDFEEHGKK